MTPTLSLPELHAAIANLEHQRSLIPTVDLDTIERAIQHHAARQNIGTPTEQAEHKAALVTAVALKEEAAIHLQRRAEIERTLARLKQDLEVATYRNQQAGKQSLANELAEAANEFRSIAKQLVRTYRRCHRLAARNRAAGADYRLPASVDMNMKFLSSNPYGDFTIGQEMEYGLLPFETREAQEAKP